METIKNIIHICLVNTIVKSIYIYDDNGYYFSLLRHFFHLVDSAWYRCDVCIKIQYFVSVSGAES